MSIRYNLNALSKRRNFSVYDLARSGIIGTSTCNSLYQQQPIMTGTLLRLLDFADCTLNDFLIWTPENAETDSAVQMPEKTGAAGSVRKLDLNGMVRRGVISRTAKRHFLNGSPMCLSTLILIARDQGADLMDFLQVETTVSSDRSGNLKKHRKVLYLSEW